MNAQPANLLLASSATLAYVLLCLRVGWRVREKRLAAAHLMAVPTRGQSAPLLVAHASQTGTAENLAMQTAETLQAAGIEVQLRSFAQLDEDTLNSAREALFVVSTYGEGDPPDAAASFVATAMRENLVDLSRMQYGLLALGDRSYRNYSGFGRQLNGWLRQRGAQPLFDPIEADNCDPAAMQAWRRGLGSIAATVDLAGWQDVSFEPWILRARELVNRGSAGGPVFRLELARQAGATLGWQPGDLIQVRIPSDPERPRDYSIASIPEDGLVHLLIRVETRSDGSTGLASGWLTRDLRVGAALDARLRAHSQFRIGDNAARDLILIGNGTGLAGLRAHLRQRAREHTAGNSPRRHWLIFGERQAAYDDLYGAELAAWADSGVLTHLDLVYSREGQPVRYVQDRLRAEGARLREWIGAGAAIYVCGSLDGMAPGVAEVLREQLGEPLLEQLQQQGRYRRDVY